MPICIAGGAAAFAGGVLISLINYRISRRILLKNPDRYAVSTILRQLLNVGWLLLCYFAGERTGLSAAALLTGAALGVTIPSFWFARQLLHLNQTRKEDNTNG